MKLNIKKLSNIQIKRNDVYSAVKQSYINDMLQKGAFKNKFLSYWDGVSTFSLFYDSNREKMSKLLGIDKQFNGETDLHKVDNLTKGLDDLQLQWVIKPDKITDNLKNDVLSNIKDVFDKHGYVFKINKSIISIDGVDDDTKQLYILVANNITKGDGTYTFTWDDIKDKIKYDIFDRKYQQKQSKEAQFNRQPYTTGIPHLATFGVFDISSLDTNVLLVKNNKITVNRDALKSLPQDEFMDFIQSFLDFNQLYKSSKWWQDLLSIVTTIIAVITIVYGGYALATYAITGSAVAIGTATGLTALVATTSGALVASAVLMYDMYTSFKMLEGIDSNKDPQSSNSPKEAEQKISIANDYYWDGIDSMMPQGQIDRTLEHGKP